MKHASLKHFNTSGIYIIRNLINGKVYIGSAKNVKIRINVHKHYLKKGNHHSKKLQNSYNKYNGNFLISILENTPIENLLKREQYWIDYFKSYKDENGYNMLKIAGNSKGYKCSEETKIKISNANKNRKILFTDEHKENLSKNNSKHWLTHKFSEKHKRAISENIPKIRIKVIFENEYKIYSSILDTIKDLKISSKTIYKYLNSNNIFKRYNCKFETLK